MDALGGILPYILGVVALIWLSRRLVKREPDTSLNVRQKKYMETAFIPVPEGHFRCCDCGNDYKLGTNDSGFPHAGVIGLCITCASKDTVQGGTHEP